MNKRILLPLLCLAALLAGCSVRDSSSDPVTLKADIPAAALQHLVFEGTAGEAKIGVSPDDAVHVRLALHLEEKRFFGVRMPSDATLDDMEKATVGQDRKGDTLTLSAIFPSHDDHNSDVKQEWTVQLPARLSVDATMKEGRMVIRDIGGGIQAKLSAGDLSIKSAGGPVHAELRAGRVQVISDGSRPRAVAVKSAFGLAVLDLQGKYYGPPEQRGGFRFFGDSVSQTAGGKDDIDVSTTFGLAVLRVGPQGDEQEYRDLFADDDKDKD